MSKLHADLASAEAALNSQRWRARDEGLSRRRRKLEGDRHRIVNEGFDDLTRELTDEAAKVRKRLDDVLEQVGDVAGEWERLRNAWLALEQGAGGSVTLGMRLDVPTFPLVDSGDLSAVPIPDALNPNADVVIKSDGAAVA